MLNNCETNVEIKRIKMGNSLEMNAVSESRVLLGECGRRIHASSCCTEAQHWLKKQQSSHSIQCPEKKIQEFMIVFHLHGLKKGIYDFVLTVLHKIAYCCSICSNKFKIPLSSIRGAVFPNRTALPDSLPFCPCYWIPSSTASAALLQDSCHHTLKCSSVCQAPLKY